MSYMGPKIWDLTPKEMKLINTLKEFKTKFKIWKLKSCSRTYLTQCLSAQANFVPLRARGH